MNIRNVLLYGATMAVLIFILKWLQWKYIVTDNSSDIYIGLIALLFTGLGIWVAMQLVKPKVQTVIIEKQVFVSQSQEFTVNEEELKKLNLTSRENEVLQLVVQGRSNTEIAEQLFLSVSTVKTHVSNLLEKMEVKSRAQAMDKARRLKITR